MSDYTIEVCEEEERGCGYRKPDKSGVGIYLMGGDLGRPCGRLPFPLTVCPCCSAGIKPTRSWTWIEPGKLLAGGPECKVERKAGPGLMACPPGDPCSGCYMDPKTGPKGRHGLIWIGGSHYATPAKFMDEAARMGISRKVPAIPTGLELGTTVVYLAHRTAMPAQYTERPEDGRLVKGVAGPGIFTAFMPTRVDLVVESADPANLPKRAKGLKDKLGAAARLVKVVKKGQSADLGFGPRNDRLHLCHRCGKYLGDFAGEPEVKGGPVEALCRDCALDNSNKDG